MKVKIAGDERTLHEFNGRKALRAAKIVRSVGHAWPEVLSTIAAFRTQYEAENGMALDRATARQQFPPIPVMDPENRDQPLMADGKPVLYDPLGHLTDADWEASGQKLIRPRSPSWGEEIAAAFPVAFDHAEEQVLQLLALCTIDADKLGEAARAGGSEAVDDLLKAEAEDLLDKASMGELIELAVVGAELVRQQTEEKLEELGDRVGNLLSLFGLRPPTGADPAPPPAEPSTTRQPSSTSSEASTDGESDEPSTEPVGASSAPSSAE